MIFNKHDTLSSETFHIESTEFIPMYLLLSIFVIASLRLIPSKPLTTNYNNRFYSKIQKNT